MILAAITPLSSDFQPFWHAMGQKSFMLILFLVYDKINTMIILALKLTKGGSTNERGKADVFKPGRRIQGRNPAGSQAGKKEEKGRGGRARG
jgi:hypothetical protein